MLFSRQHIVTAKFIAVLIILALLMLGPTALLLGVIVRTKGRKITAEEAAYRRSV
jgi:ABC-type transport system involved in multi-copper enzyme maturation permease subunit